MGSRVVGQIGLFRVLKAKEQQSLILVAGLIEVSAWVSGTLVVKEDYCLSRNCQLLHCNSFGCQSLLHAKRLEIRLDITHLNASRYF